MESINEDNVPEYEKFFLRHHSWSDWREVSQIEWEQKATELGFLGHIGGFSAYGWRGKVQVKR